MQHCTQRGERHASVEHDVANDVNGVLVAKRPEDTQRFTGDDTQRAERYQPDRTHQSAVIHEAGGGVGIGGPPAVTCQWLNHELPGAPTKRSGCVYAGSSSASDSEMKR